MSRPDRARPLLHREDGVGALPLQEALGLLTGNLEQFLDMMQTFRRQKHDGIVLDDVHTPALTPMLVRKTTRRSSDRRDESRGEKQSDAKKKSQQ